MATGYGWGALQTAIALTGLGTIANTATGITAAFTLPLATNATAGTVQVGDLELTITSATPTGGNIQGVFLVSDDGSTFDPYGVSNSQLFPFDSYWFQIPLLPSVAVTQIKKKGLWLPPVPSGGSNVELVLYNLSGVSITVSAANLYPAGSSAG